MKNLIAQKEQRIGEPLKGIGNLGLEGQDASSAPSLFNKIISSAIGLMTIIAFIWFFFKFITGAIGIIGAGSDKEAVKSAKNNITTGLIGLIVVIAAIFIFELIGNILGIENILNPAALLEKAITF